MAVFCSKTTSALEEPAKSEAGRAAVAERETEVDVSTDVLAGIRAAKESEADTSSTAFGQAEVMEILAKAEWGRVVAASWNQDAQNDSLDVLSLTEDSDEASEDFAWRWSNAQIDQLLLKPKKISSGVFDRAEQRRSRSGDQRGDRFGSPGGSFGRGDFTAGGRIAQF